MASLSPLDPSSFSRPEFAEIKHVSLKLNVDFDTRVLSGSAILDFNILQNVDNVILDVKQLLIESVQLVDGTPLDYVVDEEVPNFGSKLTIKLPKSLSSGEQPCSPDPTPHTLLLTYSCLDGTYKPTMDEHPLDHHASCSCPPEQSRTLKAACSCANADRSSQLKLKIEYRTSPSASALAWLEPSQTSGKVYPYLFSQCQPIHARSILPCQDTPAVKFTYDAEVTAPREFTVLMSALRDEPVGNSTCFRQPVPIPAYLLAVAVGVLEHRRIGPRSLVWSESAEITRAAWEFADTEKYLQAAEALCGRYEWTQYDLLVLPPSFPYGGMENPCLTFVTPTLLAGDRTQADVIVHEIMHSWTGNLVTNRNFEHFWLNEGFTVFLERKVGAALLPDSAAGRRSRDFHSLLGLQELRETVALIGATNQLTALVVDLKNGVHPDDAFSSVPYEKGSLFLRYLENLLGGPEVFDEFLRAYLQEFRTRSLDTDQFKSFFLNHFAGHPAAGQVDWAAWLGRPGMPPVIPDYDTSMTKAVTDLIPKVDAGSSIPEEVIEAAQALSTHQLINFLQELLDRDSLPIHKLSYLGEALCLTENKNSEILYRWLRLCIRSRDETKVQDALDFVNNQGRMKYVRPVYRDLYAWDKMRQRAITNFLANEKYMMHVSAYTVRKDLHIDAEEKVPAQ